MKLRAVVRASAIAALGLVLSLRLAATPPKPKRHHATSHKRAVHKTRKHREEGISPERAVQIQKALMQAGYLKQTSGSWDSDTMTALKKYQADHHWQTRFVPDARALLALGLVTPAVDSAAAADTQLADSGGRR